MRVLTSLLLLVALPTGLLAQDPAPQPAPPPVPIVEQAIIIQTEEITPSRELTAPPGTLPAPASAASRKLFWLGVVVSLTGAILTGLSVTTERESDLSEEHPNTRLNEHLAPCGTDPSTTDLPIADCKVNSGLLYFGLGVTAAGTALTWYAIDASTPAPAAALRYTVRLLTEDAVAWLRRNNIAGSLERIAHALEEALVRHQMMTRSLHMSDEIPLNKPGQDTVVPIHTFRLTLDGNPHDVRGAAADIIQEGWFVIRNAQGLNVEMYAPGAVTECVVVEAERGRDDRPRPEPTES